MAIVTHAASIAITFNPVRLSSREVGRGQGTYPDVCKSWIQRLKTIVPSRLCHNRDHGHGDPHETVLEDSKPNNLAEADTSVSNILPCKSGRSPHIEPGQSAPRRPPYPPLTPTTPFEPIHRQNPLFRFQYPEIIFLTV